MKKEYDLKKMNVRRRGVLPVVQAEKTGARNKVRITISLDKDVVEYFKGESSQPGAFPYQTQINQALRQLIDRHHNRADIEAIKSELLHDRAFIHKLSKQIIGK